jgi:hypothetical protein
MPAEFATEKGDLTSCWEILCVEVRPGRLLLDTVAAVQWQRD